MKRLVLILIWCVICWPLAANGRLDIPLAKHVVKLAPMDGPTGSTPDPTDPNQFCASLTGNTLLIETQHETVSYVVIRTDFSETNGEDYFYALSTDSVSCPITQPGTYYIRIGHWDTDFTGMLIVKSIVCGDLEGRYYGSVVPENMPSGFYFITLNTNLGVSNSKFYLVK